MEVTATIKLNSGYDMPTVGLGTWTMFQNPEGEMRRVIRAAVEAGYRHIDTALVYGTEPLIGAALAELYESGELKREDMFITCKLWCTKMNPAEAKKSVEQSLKDLRTDYIDMLLIHWPVAYQAGEGLFPKDSSGEVIFASDDYVDTWRAMEECVDSGHVRSIGLSNFNISQMERVMKMARIQPSNLQVELNAYHQNQAVAEFCKSRGIVLSCYAPFGNPSRTWKEDGEPNLLEEASVKQLAEAKGKSSAQILLRFLLQKGYVVLPKSVTESRIQMNIEVMDFSLNEEEMQKLESLNRNLRVYREGMAKNHPNYPFPEEWK